MVINEHLEKYELVGKEIIRGVIDYQGVNTIFGKSITK